MSVKFTDLPIGTAATTDVFAVAQADNVSRQITAADILALGSSTYATRELDNLGTTAINADLNMTSTNTVVVQNDVAYQGFFGSNRDLLKVNTAGRVEVGYTGADIILNGGTRPDGNNTRSLGIVGLAWSDVVSEQFNINNSGIIGRGLTLPSGQTGAVGLRADGAASQVALYTEDEATADATASGSVNIETGNKTAGTGDSGDINLQIGTSAGGSQGTINFIDASLASASVNDVWKLDNATTGAGSWTDPNTFIDHNQILNYLPEEHISFARQIYVDPSGSADYTTLTAAITAASALSPTANSNVYIFLSAGTHTIDNSVSTPVVPQHVHVFGAGRVTRLIGASSARTILAMRSLSGFYNAYINIGSAFTMFEVNANGVNPSGIINFAGLIIDGSNIVFDIYQGIITIKNCTINGFGATTLVETANLTADSTSNLIEGCSFDLINTIIDTQTTSFNLDITVTKCTVINTFFGLGRLFEMNSGTLISTYNTFGGGGTVIYDLDGTATLQCDYNTQTGTYTNNFLTGAAGVSVTSNYGKWDETDFSLFVEDHRPNTYFDTNTGKFINAGDSNSFVEIPLLEYGNFFE